MKSLFYLIFFGIMALPIVVASLFGMICGLLYLGWKSGYDFVMKMEEE